MVMKFADIPATDERLSRSRTKPPAASRRMVLRTGFTVATAAALGALETVNSAVARAAYFQDYTNTGAGPCHPTTGYARHHTENGLKCGPSLMCTACCWTGGDTAANRKGWHRVGDVSPVEYYQRPDQCFSGTYDSWRWKFTGNRTWRCSDGYRYTNSAGTVKTICPWDVTPA
ncbi:MAG TPA: hypothetical protein VF755_06575 [Catenuloplanes sp.]